MLEQIKNMMSGLNGKILTLAGLPVIVIGLIAFIGNTIISGTFSSTQEQLETLNSQVAQADKLSTVVETSNAQAQRLAADIARTHQTMLITRNAGLATQTVTKKQTLAEELKSLNASVSALRSFLEKGGYVPANIDQALAETSEAKFNLDSRKIFFQLVRLSETVANQFDLFASANGRTISLAQAGNFAGANANFQFEETARLNAFNGGLARLANALEGSIVELKRQTDLERTTLNEMSGDDISSTIVFVMILIVILIIAIIFGASFFTSKVIITPIRAQVGAMNELAAGRMDVDIPEAKDTDLAQIAKALSAFKAGLVEKAELEEQQKQAEAEERARQENEQKLAREREEEERERERRASEEVRERTERMEALISGFETSIGDVLASVADASNALEQSAGTMRQVASDSEIQSSEVAAASTQASSNVSSVAAASEEMAASVQEISRQVVTSSDMTRQATSQAEETDKLVQKLAENISKIDDVVTLINDIADQTNLLALNATIEAARAGDAGKGFAVVASEVKALASQTAQATDDIRRQTMTVKGMSDEASRGMASMLSVFQQTTEIAGSIAAAVEEQNASTIEISQAAGEAANSTDRVSLNIGDLKNGTQNARSASEQVFEASSLLSSQSENLQQVVESFLRDIATAQSA
ncbi:methyl-accepting chemotaxis protein [Kordiimonas sp. SCSIO 12610]|uniref:methyl-accepting chemotaxis protein n=1 Tax=Kordiimonas sp. SCSIO 12610 TaxID=2829597 RepID=UPI00210EA742|nr:methyl-accepting chemotaxis protein [Kordiimonas sp. SCSIO 12610]UTW56753.1 hypothetical protein KFF44_07655 [Kordiimonas sp. SCSIO 12610]